MFIGQQRIGMQESLLINFDDRGEINHDSSLRQLDSLCKTLRRYLALEQNEV